MHTEKLTNNAPWIPVVETMLPYVVGFFAILLLIGGIRFVLEKFHQQHGSPKSKM
jgi:hypothetical protein